MNLLLDADGKYGTAATGGNRRGNRPDAWGSEGLQPSNPWR